MDAIERYDTVNVFVGIDSRAVDQDRCFWFVHLTYYLGYRESKHSQ